MVIRLTELEHENSRLKKMCAESQMMAEGVREVLEKK